MKAVAALVLVAAVTAAATTAALAAQSPQTLRASIFAAARARHSVHYSIASTQAGKSLQIVGDVAAGRGTQRLTLRSKGTTGHVTVTVVNRTAYLRGDRPGLRQMGLPATAASGYAGKWISVAHRDSAYAALAEAVTFESFLADIYPASGLALVHRSGAVGLRGRAKLDGQAVTETLVARESGAPLPLTEDQAGKSSRSHVVMSGWNEEVHVRAPANATPIATVVGGGGGVPA